MRRRSGEYVRQGVHTAGAGHHDVEQDHVGPQGARLLDRLEGVACLADDVDVALRLEQEPQPGAHHCVVITDENADSHGRSVAAGATSDIGLYRVLAAGCY